MLSAAVRRTSRDVSIMKEKLIFSGDSLHGPWIRRFTCNTEGQVDIASFQALTHALTEGQKHVRQPQIQGLGDRLFEGPTFLLSSHVTSISDGCVLSPAALPMMKAAVKTCKTGYHCTSWVKSQGRKCAQSSVG